MSTQVERVFGRPLAQPWRAERSKGSVMSVDFETVGQNADALFTLKLHRGDGMCLIAMNWKTDEPPKDLVGFAIEYKEPGGQKFFPLKNRIAFPGAAGAVNPNRLSTRLSPIQMFRWVHFPRNAELVESSSTKLRLCS
jgi:hypothetical protein